MTLTQWDNMIKQLEAMSQTPSADKRQAAALPTQEGLRRIAAAVAAIARELRSVELNRQIAE